MNSVDHFRIAKVYLAQARHFMRKHRAFAFTLLGWAANARRRGVAAMTPQAPQQMSLFGGGAAMTICNHAHAPNDLCTDPSCYWTARNPYWRLQRRYERAMADLRKAKRFITKKLSRSGGAA